MKKLLLIGASGFIGTALQQGLKDYEITVYRGRSIHNKSVEDMANDFEGQNIIINLAGKSIFTVWTKSNKKTIYHSRIDTGEKIVKAIQAMMHPPEHYINASAIGIYKSETPVEEFSEKFDDTFLAETIMDWEKCFEPLTNLGIRLSITRFGIVFGKGGGAYKILRMLTKLNAGAYFNKGNQSLSFVFIQDLVNAINFIIDEEISGIVNIVAPEHTNYRQLLKLMKEQMNAFIIWRIPGSLMKLVAGEASQLLLRGHIVKPAVLIKNNFNFEAPDIDTCINKLEE